jgi:hypothetical protein
LIKKEEDNKADAAQKNQKAKKGWQKLAFLSIKL